MVHHCIPLFHILCLSFFICVKSSRLFSSDCSLSLKRCGKTFWCSVICNLKYVTVHYGGKVMVWGSPLFQKHRRESKSLASLISQLTHRTFTENPRLWDQSNHPNIIRDVWQLRGCKSTLISDVLGGKMDLNIPAPLPNTLPLLYVCASLLHIPPNL